MFSNKVLLVTGGTGSFGHAVARRFLNTDIKEIRVFSRDEKKQDEMRNRFRNDKLKFYLGDVRDFNSINDAMKGVDYVFHAAALKQVPSCEFYPMEALKTNTIGTDNAVNSAIQNKVKKFILLSTDKAVYPINAMGMSKALAEKIIVAKSRNLTVEDTVLCVTRYGNVMASRGSVIPLFIKQIKEKKDITITDPIMTRFLMTLDEAVDLVLYAFNNAENGDIFVQKAPASTVEDLAKALIELFDAKSEIKIIGTRHGEKQSETLLTREEMIKSSDLNSFYRVPSDVRDLNYEKYFSKGQEEVTKQEDYNSNNTTQLRVEEVKELLLKLDIIKHELNFEDFNGASTELIDIL
ncbi:SDR family NAD(P)-dependent oxidoreductase [Paenibacillus sp. Soil787]|uniref:SDR family NAD(P)-dependent oxidoreductase n=1 Tax=Paenibacillus sp. Soil787 TaxID=1736411 RepID=UPI0006FA472B|nr:SDR family NAD(P)-dependent oxidoreductase [Paenibacillus sp. Soil787]KRF39104.1 UDP-glucose 4-epimerase [Paenibacillus sp. Soil787]